MSKGEIRIRLEGYDYEIVDRPVERIISVVERTGAVISGPVPLPTEKKIITVLRSTQINKDSREQFEIRTHKRLIDIYKTNSKTVESLSNLEIPAGVKINVELSNSIR